MARPNRAVSVSPKSPAQSRTSGIRLSGTSSISPISADQACLRMSNRRVREALVASVAWTALELSGPPVSFQITHASMVPARSSPASARALAPSTSSSSQAILVPEK